MVGWVNKRGYHGGRFGPHNFFKYLNGWGVVLGWKELEKYGSSQINGRWGQMAWF